MNYSLLIRLIQSAVPRIRMGIDAESAFLQVLGITSFTKGREALLVHGLDKDYFLDLLNFADPLIRRDLGLVNDKLDNSEQAAYLMEEIRYLEASRSYAMCEVLYGLVPLSAIPGANRGQA